ncbi:MAG: FHA domain-containing protein [Dehalococcoidia bacterium]
MTTETRAEPEMAGVPDGLSGADAHPERDDIDDIYTVLGVREDASPLLAREMYWARIQPLLDPERRDDPDARATIEALNRALAIISDSEQRADYDALVHPEAARIPDAPQGALLRWLWRATLVAGLASALFILGVQSSWTTALVAGATCLVFLAVASVATRPHTPATTPHQRLGVGEDATKRDLDIAYQTRAQQLLVQLGTDARVVEGLNELDRDYLAAMRLIIAPEVGEPSRGGMHTVAARAVAALRHAVSPPRRDGHARGEDAARPLPSESTAPPVVDREPPAATPARRPAVRDDILAAPSEASPVEPPPPGERRWGLGRRSEGTPPPAIDLERRLAASLKASALEIASRPPGDAPPEQAAAAPPTPAYLCLFASVGVRKVPIAERPLRIGSAADCDLVLPERQGVAAEHALVWRRGDAVVLHVTDPSGECAVNGRGSTWATLEHGDELRIGDVELRIEIDASEI